MNIRPALQLLTALAMLLSLTSCPGDSEDYGDISKITLWDLDNTGDTPEPISGSCPAEAFMLHLIIETANDSYATTTFLHSPITAVEIFATDTRGNTADVTSLFAIYPMTDFGTPSPALPLGGNGTPITQLGCGNWKLAMRSPLPADTYTFIADVTLANGSTLSSQPTAPITLTTKP